MGINWKRNHIFKGGYSSYLNDKWHEFQGLDGCMEEIRNSIDEVLSYAEGLEEENQWLKDEHWKDDELQKMKADRDLMAADYYRGFPITESEAKAIKEWENNHWVNQHNAPNLESRLNKMGAIGGSYYYKFIPTSIGVAGSVCCTSCMAKAQANAGNNRDRLNELIKEYDAEFDFQQL